MYDDDHESDPVFYEYDDSDETSHPSRLRGCVFASISIIVIAGLIVSSMAAWLIVRQREAQSVNSANSSTDLPDTAPVTRMPTAAPATVVAALPTAAPVETTVPVGPVVNRIAIINGDGQVETLSPTGESRRVLTDEGNDIFFQFPTWAPEGDRLAVIGSRFAGGGIYVLPDGDPIGTLNSRQIYFSGDETPFYLYWSPDSENLAFLANQSRNTMGLKVVPGDGQGDSRLLATGTPFYWDWTDDGRQLLIHSGRNQNESDLALIDVRGEIQAENLATPGLFQAPGIGPGGRYFAFAEETDDDLSALVVVDTQTGERLPYEQAGSLALSWSPTRNEIAFTNGTVDGHPYWGPLYLLDVTTGESRLLTRQTVLAFFWSPDGQSIAYLTISRSDDEGGINAQTPSKTRRVARVITPAQQSQGFLTLSVIDTETGRGLRLLDFEPTVTYISQFLPFFDQYALSHRIWSPDSSKLVLPVRDETGNAILVVPARGGRPYRLAEGEIAFWSQR